MTDLARAERWIQDVMTDPEGVDAALTARTVAPEAVVSGSADLDARARLALYSRTYHRRLLRCLRESYPALRHLLGDELFDDFARDYLRVRPPRSYTLAALGAGWPAHLAATRPDAGRPLEERDQWPDLMIDLARLERAFVEVYDGPGVEGETLVAAADLPDEPIPDAGVTVVSCLRLLGAGFPLSDYLAAVRRGEQPPLPAPAASFVAVSRRDYVVTMTELGPDGRALLEALTGGAVIAAAAHAAGVAPADAWRFVRRWADRGLIATIAAPGRPPRPPTGIHPC